MTRMRVVAAVLLIAAVTVGAVLAFGRRGDDGATLRAAGTLEATEADLGFQLGGRIRDLLVVEGERVAAGQELARLDAAELEARRAAAEAQLEGARALLSELQTGARPEELQQARSAEVAARERMAEAARQVTRAEALEAGGAVSREALEQARTAHQVARSQHEQAQQQLMLVQRGPRTERVLGQQAVVRQAESVIAQADAALANALIRAPFAGIVTVRHRQPGESVGAGAPVVTVMNPDDRWVRIYVRQDLIGRVSIGQEAEVRTDSDPDRTYTGRVTFIGSEAEFTPRNVQTAEQRVRLVYAVKVAIVGDDRLVLKPGVPADVTLRVQ
jgi:HlyD family secretion protein